VSGSTPLIAITGSAQTGISPKSISGNAVKREEHHKHHTLAIQDARLRDRKLARRQNLAMAFAGGAFLVTAATSVTLINDLHENARLLTELGSDINDINLFVERHLSGMLQVPAQAVAKASANKTWHLEDTPRPATPVSAQTVHVAANSLAKPEGDDAQPAGYRSVSNVTRPRYDLLHERLTGSEKTATGQPPVPTVMPAMPKDIPKAVAPREGLTREDGATKTAVTALLYGSLAELDKIAGQFPTNSVTDNNATAVQRPHSVGMMRKRASAELTHGQNDEATYFTASYEDGNKINLGVAFARTIPEDNVGSTTDRNESFWQLKMSSSLLGPILDAEIAFGSFESEPDQDLWSSDYRKLKLGLQTTWQGFSLGASYQSAGKGYENPEDILNTGKKKNKDTLEKDTQGTELWAYRQFGNIGLKTYVSQYSNNLAEDRNLPRFSTQKAGGLVHYQFSSLPQAGVTLEYAAGTTKSLYEPAGVNSVSQDVRHIGSSIYYAGNPWSGSLSVENATGKANGASITDVQSYYAEAAYFPSNAVSISPGISYSRQKYAESDVSTDTLSTSLTSSYKPAPNGLNYNLYGEYATEKNRDWRVDNSHFYVSLGVNRDLRKPRLFINHWSFELFYDQYRDNYYSNSDGPGFMLKLGSSPKPARRFVDGLR
jgi:hypothetical protein